MIIAQTHVATKNKLKEANSYLLQTVDAILFITRYTLQCLRSPARLNGSHPPSSPAKRGRLGALVSSWLSGNLRLHAPTSALGGRRLALVTPFHSIFLQRRVIVRHIQVSLFLMNVYVYVGVYIYTLEPSIARCFAQTQNTPSRTCPTEQALVSALLRRGSTATLTETATEKDPPCRKPEMITPAARARARRCWGGSGGTTLAVRSTCRRRGII
jgi:hypothetical protein